MSVESFNLVRNIDLMGIYVSKLTGLGMILVHGPFRVCVDLLHKPPRRVLMLYDS